MSLEFNEDTLIDLCELVTDGSHHSPPSQVKGYYMASVKDMGTYKFNYSDCRKISEEDYNKLVKSGCSPKNDDILIAKDGSPLSNIFIYKEEYPMVLLSSIAIIRANKNKILPEFLKYYLENHSIKRYIQTTYTSGSVIPRIILKDFKKFPIIYPNMENQKKIIGILRTIDKKIAINEEINKNFEKTLSEIFKSWFINFEIYDNTVGMKIDENFGEIPKIWTVEMLDEYVDFVSGIEPGSKNYHEEKEDNCIPFIRVGNLGSRDNMVYIDKNLSKNKILEPTDIVLSLDATIGIVKIGLKGAYSTGMRKLVIKNDNITKVFLYCLVKSKRIQNIIETFATGTTILHAGKSITHMDFVLPDAKTMKKFNKIGEPIFLKILKNKKEITKLINLRNLLLPKLMSGEIDVSSIEL
ncbi:restriction endonuclease subunit S [Methanobrevibacter sp. V74]|uniref:restriction endonuclease subunit S n=1 Tax=Methanobrevibacter sp. V74 TaxID=3064279 RepID=UPI0027369B42|nr:restriction endonuclease subunit S [Methanobrevibacter sp. V74]